MASKKGPPPLCQWPGCTAVSGWSGRCDQSYVPRKYCRAHLSAFRSRPKIGRHKKVRPVKVCQTCGARYELQPYSRGLYCSRPCAYEAQRTTSRLKSCLHCGRPGKPAGRGLCWTCYNDEAVKALYRPDPRCAGGDLAAADIAARARLVREGKL